MCSTQLSAEFKLLIKIKIPANEVSCFSLSDGLFIMLIIVKMPTIVCIFSIYEQDKFLVQLS